MIAKIDELVKLEEARIQPLNLPVIRSQNILLDVLRLDKIHATISGNKWFKLKYSLHAALLQKRTRIVTLGGAYSNHIVATACACQALGLLSTGIIRTEEPEHLSCSLLQARKFGMELKFVSRSDFKNKPALYESIKTRYHNSYLIEEGGSNELGVKGITEIFQLLPANKYNYICCALGTGTMLAGLIAGSEREQEVIGICSLKVNKAENKKFFTEQFTKNNYEIFYDYHFGGYARFTEELINFMNEFFIETSIPTDFVYTSKLCYGILDLAKKGFFKPGATVLLIHSGGLQGNCSLPEGALLF